MTTIFDPLTPNYTDPTSTCDTSMIRLEAAERALRHLMYTDTNVYTATVRLADDDRHTLDKIQLASVIRGNLAREVANGAIEKLTPVKKRKLDTITYPVTEYSMTVIVTTPEELRLLLQKAMEIGRESV